MSSTQCAFAVLMEVLSAVMLAYIVSASAPLSMRLLAVTGMILPGLVSGVCRFEYCKSHTKLAAGVLILHAVEGLLAFISVGLSSGLGGEKANETEQVFLYGSFIAGACLLSVDAAAMIHAVAHGAAAALDCQKIKPETPPLIQRFSFRGGDGCKDNLEDVLEETQTCVICLQDLELGDEVGELVCCHRFHFSCLDTWIKSRSHPPWCPLRCGNMSSSEQQPEP